MEYISHYNSPLGDILLAADDIGLTGLWFEGQKYFGMQLDEEHTEKDTAIFAETTKWLDIYFSGKEPDFAIPLHLRGTGFQQKVWKILRNIPYGTVTTYKEIAKQIAVQTRRVSVLPDLLLGKVLEQKFDLLPVHNQNLTGWIV